MHDRVNEHGILVHDYGSHTFYTSEKELYYYMCRFSEWDKYRLMCGAEINGLCTPTPFNYQTIDEACLLKSAIEKTFANHKTAIVVEYLNCDNKLVRDYAQFLFDNDYSLDTATQWGASPSEIALSILKRVPLRFNYEGGLF